MTISQLDIFDDSHLRKLFNWYILVDENRVPAKFRIARTIKCDFQYSDSFDILWDQFQIAYKCFEKEFHKIREQETTLGVISTPNLIDLIVAITRKNLFSCNFCFFECKVDRTRPGKRGICQLGSKSRISSYFHHHGEEKIFRGFQGSGTIFFTSCNFRCAFCQNGDISTDSKNGEIIDAINLASIMRILRLEGVHNINFVGGDPIIHLHTIAEGIQKFSTETKYHNNSESVFKIKSDHFSIYKKQKNRLFFNGDFNVPMLWNSNFYMSNISFHILKVLMDIWLPDLKFFNDDCARRLSKVPNYFEIVSSLILQLYNMKENLVIRHLIMPNHIECCTIPILNWIHNTIPDVAINLMTQYHPYMRADPKNVKYDVKFIDISRFLNNDEIEKVFSIAEKLQLNYKPFLN